VRVGNPNRIGEIVLSSDNHSPSPTSMKKQLLSLIPLLAFASVASAAVTLVDSAPYTTAASGSGTNSFTSAYQVAESGNNNTLVAIYSARGSGSDPTITSATFGGVSMINVDTQTTVDGSFRQVTSIYYLNEADFGGTFTSAAQDFEFTTTDTPAQGITVTFLTLAGVNQTTTTGQVEKNGLIDTADLPLDLTGLTTGSLIVSGASGGYQGTMSATVPSGNIDTVLYNGTGGNQASIAGLTDVTGSSESLSYTYSSTSGRTAGVAAEFVAIPEPSSFTLMGLALGGMLLFRRKRC